jgi:uncharacterized protein with HEPN domain
MGTFARKVQSYTQDLTQTEFVADELIYDATLRNLELIGEAATHIPAEMREANPDIPLAADHCYPQSINSRLPRYR